MQLIPLKDICFIDFETTGLSFSDSDRAIELTIIKTNNKNLKLHAFFGISNIKLDSKTFRLNPEGKKSSKNALEIHKISDACLVNEKTFKEQYSEIIDFIDRDYVMAHNAPFDQGFFEMECFRAKKTVNLKWLEHYNKERTHQGKMCYGRTPWQTFLDGKKIVEDKMLSGKFSREVLESQNEV